MTLSFSRIDWRTPLLAAAGPAAIGAVLGMPKGGGAMASGAAVLPAILLGVTLLMIPALYITLSLLGVAPPARETPGHLGRALAAMGTVLLGLAAPAAFLAATMGSAWTALVLGAGVTAFGTLVGLRRLFTGMFASRSASGTAVAACGAWSLVALVIGARLFVDALGGAA